MTRQISGYRHWRSIAKKVAVVVFSAVFVALLPRISPYPHERLDVAWWDLCGRVWPYEIQAPLVQIVDIDDGSLAVIGRWPWSRRVMAELLDRLREAGAAVVGFDLRFTEPSRDAGTTGGDDERFADAIRRTPVVIGFLMTNTHGNGEVIRKAGFTFLGQGFHPEKHFLDFAEAIADLPILQAMASGIGYANVHVDRDGVIRQAPLIALLQHKPVPSFAAEIVRVARTAKIYFASGGPHGLNEVLIGKVPVRTDGVGNVWLHYAPSWPGRFIHAADVLGDRFDRGRVAGQIVLVGVSASSLPDHWASPLGSTMPGVEILAQLVEQMLRGQLLSRPDWVIGAEFLAALAAGAVIVVAASFGRIWGSSAGAVAILLTAGLCVIGYTHLHLLIDPLRPALMLAMATVGAVLIQQPPRNGGQPA